LVIRQNAPSILLKSQSKKGALHDQMVIDFIEYKEKTAVKKLNSKTKDIPVVRICTPPLNDTTPFFYTEVKKEQK
jgi:hypothetical protein